MENQNNILPGFDSEKFLSVFRKNLLLLLLIFFVINTVGYLFFIRWKKPVYESVSELRLDIKSEASELGIATFAENQNFNIISGEIELIRSKLFFNKVLDEVDLSMSYFTKGKVLDDEKYKASPFKADIKLKNDNFMDRNIHVDLIDSEKYRLKYAYKEEKYETIHAYGEKIENEHFELIISLTSHYTPSIDEEHYFRLNSREALILNLESNLEVVPSNLNAKIIRISFRDHNAVKARDLVHAIDTLYMVYSDLEKKQANKQKIEWLAEELDRIEEVMEENEAYTEAFTIENRTLNLDLDLMKTIAAINEIDSQRFDLNRRINQIRLVMVDLEAGKPLSISMARSPALGPEIKDELMRYEEIRSDLDRIALTYNEITYSYQQKEQELQTIYASVKEKLGFALTNLQEQNRELEKQKNRLEASFKELPAKGTEFKKAQRFYKIYEELFTALMQTKAQFEITDAGTTPDFKILAPASLPKQPISPNKILVHGASLVVSLMLCFIFLGLVYLFNNKITHLSELEKVTHTPILGMIPSANQNNGQGVIIDQQPKSAISEAFRSLRTNLEFMLPGPGPKVLSTTSTISGEGKSFVTINLAAAHAMSGKRTVILDLDMRKSKIQQLLTGDISQHKGMSTILSGKDNFEDCIQNTSIEGLQFIPAGPNPPNPSELLVNGKMDDMLTKLKKDYQMIFLDTPPVGLVTDGQLAMKKADLCLYVFKAHYSKIAFTKTLNRLAKMNDTSKLAIIFNGQDRKERNSYGYGYYEEPKSRWGFLGRIFRR